MNIQEKDILKAIAKYGFTNQRQMSVLTGHSLGSVNRSINDLMKNGDLLKDGSLSASAIKEIENCRPKNAVILAAGYGMRMVPINTEVPKGLLEVKGEPLIERQIRQLQEAGIREIIIAVGFMKEKYEYLIDQFGVKLVVVPDYSTKNNLHTVWNVSKYLSNTYIIPCDIWCRENPFQQTELYSWYMVSEEETEDSMLRVNRRQELIPVQREEKGNVPIGISYLMKEDSRKLVNQLAVMSREAEYDTSFWEEALFSENDITIYAKRIAASDYAEINTYEQLREIDEDSNHLRSDAIQIIMDVFHAEKKAVTDITVLKKGMTNRSFMFTCRDKKYIMRIPGEGTDKLINRRQEADVYHVISGKKISDNIIYINPENGYKITEFINDVRTCDAEDPQDVQKCMRYLKKFHDQKLKVGHEFDIFGMIEFYESLWGGTPSVYRDYSSTKANVLALKPIIEQYRGESVLTHIDAVPDNFLFTKNENGEEEIRLIDWEYAGMQDPHVDIAMFCIYSLYEKEQTDQLIDYYFEGNCSKEIRRKIYCYIAACGLLWSNWCEYKRNLGVEFGEYSLRQYRYAKEYYRIVMGEAGEA